MSRAAISDDRDAKDASRRGRKWFLVSVLLGGIVLPALAPIGILVARAINPADMTSEQWQRHMSGLWTFPLLAVGSWPFVFYGIFAWWRIGREATKSRSAEAGLIGGLAALSLPYVAILMILLPLEVSSGDAPDAGQGSGMLLALAPVAAVPLAILGWLLGRGVGWLKARRSATRQPSA